MNAAAPLSPGARRALLRIGQLAARAGVPRATVQFYLRQRLLPEPFKTGKTMAYYRPECVDRILLIKELQRRYLPLEVIRALIDGEGRGRRGLRAMHFAGQRIRAALEPEERPLGRADALAMTGIAPEALSALERLGLVRAEPARGGDRFGPFDVALLRAVGKLRPRGIDDQSGLSAEDLVIYRDAMRALVNKEIETFSRKLAPGRSPEQIVQLGIAAATGATEVLVSIRNKLIAEFVAAALPRGTRADKGMRGAAQRKGRRGR